VRNTVVAYSMPAGARAKGKGERRPRAEGEADEGWHEIEEEEPPRSEARRKALSEALQKVSPSSSSARGVWTQPQCLNAQAHERDARTRAHAHSRVKLTCLTTVYSLSRCTPRCWAMTRRSSFSPMRCHWLRRPSAACKRGMHPYLIQVTYMHPDHHLTLGSQVML
jgi:hypothetical protein